MNVNGGTTLLHYVLDWIKNYGPVAAAIAIAGSSVYTAWILRRQNKPTGWLKVNAARVQRINFHMHMAFDEHGTPTQAPVPPGQDEGGQELHLELTNTGYHLERVQQVHYHSKGNGWLRVPDSTGGFRPRRPEDDAPPNVPVVPFSISYTPFDVEPQHTKRWEYRVSNDRGSATLSSISCVRVVTTKEMIHARLQDTGRLMWLRRRWRELCCKAGVHR